MPIDERVWDLVGRIADDKKPNLLTARGYRKTSRQALPELGVPSYYWGSNCIHSSMSANCTEDGRCSTSFPSGPSWAATFDRELMRRMAVVVGRETRAFFNLGNFTDNGQNGMGLNCWGPVLNVNRDPRWGRHGEGGTEDPFLMGELGVAWTKGLQNGESEDKRFIQVAVTLKHFDANSLEGGGKADQGFDRHNFSARISKYLLADYYWPAFKASIKQGHAKGVMCSYNAINGIPACMDPLMRAARESWGFSGYVTSDTDAVEDAWKRHHHVKTAAEASCLAVKDGHCDINSGNTYYQSLLDGVKEGYCSMGDVDRALFNSLRIRFELGLFDPTADQPYWKLGQSDIGRADGKELNLRAALSSLVLIQNPLGLLPLRQGQRIAVIGPHANASMDLIQTDTGAVCPQAANNNWTHRSGNSEPSSFYCIKSPYQAIDELNRALHGTTIYAKGCNLSTDIAGGFDEALSAAKAADVVILGLGISEREDIGINRFLEREAHDRDSIDLPPVQKNLASSIVALGKPTIVFLLNGGMVAVEEFLNRTNVALIEAFYPGMEGADALAQSIFGKANRWGRMPYTVYKSDWTQSNSMLDHDVTHQRTYRYGAEAVVPFGFGLSLTHFTLAFEHETAAQATLEIDNEAASHTVTVQVSNRGSLAGDEVVLAYFHPIRVGLPMHPKKSLFDFRRINDIGAGGQAIATFTITQNSILLATLDGDLVRAPGDYKLTFENGAGEVLSMNLRLAGAQVVVEPFPRSEQNIFV
eukprot:TRINITY_DN56620_c0_g1_i1.p1 TRINITY_DN56620_c0_g1~~TRINITY_DN56620_c0_g1_i1.p1  ORF type:complete len:828 (-),score=123.36 TRINITY_DN56620_c0_g1_i1:71-2341(-)